MEMYEHDTIAAVATPVGLGGIGIVKLSGPRSLEIITPLFRSASSATQSLKTHRLRYGRIIDPHDGCAVDEVLIAYLQGPCSYTGEDVVEINCHSGMVVLQQILDLVLKGGARLAAPGEFTKRAYCNGRIDLTQAEAVIDVVHAQTETSLKLALRQLTGGLASTLRQIREQLLEVTALIEACIDFPEDDLGDFIQEDEMIGMVRRAAEHIETLINSYQEGHLYHTGIRVVITGKPNVGKSSLLNALLGETRAIVTDVPGTTRDVLRETINLQGIPVKLLDTAGLHCGTDAVEKIGMQMTVAAIADADLVLLVLDGSCELDSQDDLIIDTVTGRKIIAVINKSDLPQTLMTTKLYQRMSLEGAVAISALYRTGIDVLKELIVRSVVHQGGDVTSNLLISNIRHKTELEKTLVALHRVVEGLHRRIPPELSAVDMQDALRHIGELTGEITTEHILDSIFSRFCIGK